MRALQGQHVLVASQPCAQCLDFPVSLCSKVRAERARRRPVGRAACLIRLQRIARLRIRAPQLIDLRVSIRKCLLCLCCLRRAAAEKDRFGQRIAARARLLHCVFEPSAGAPQL